MKLLRNCLIPMRAGQEREQQWLKKEINIAGTECTFWSNFGGI